MNNTNKKNIKVGLIIIALIIVIVCVFGYFKFIKSSDDSKQNNNQQTNKAENKSNNSTDIVDENTNLNYDKTGAFLMSIEDVFTITGKGTVVTGKIERGIVNIGDEIQIIGLDKEVITTTVEGIEMAKKQLDTAEFGDNVGILLKDVKRTQIERGQVLAKPKSITDATKFEADIYFLTKEEGGRHTPFFDKYSPQFYFRATDITGVVTLPDDVEMVKPGENIKLTVELVSSIAMEKGTEFNVREGGRIVGKGKVTKLY